jgi:KDO2-lipid IV(A) lauroyltransferase
MTVGVAVLALRTNATMIPIYGYWDEKKKRHVIHARTVLEVEQTGNRQHDTETITKRYTTELEKLVRAHPDQWLWIHKRWNTRPDGEPDLYD